MLKENFSKTIKKMRMDKGWTQEILSMESGLTTRTISNIENGSGCSLQTLGRLARALDISPKDFLA